MDNQNNWIKEKCLEYKGNNPIELIINLMKDECIRIHGPEHHILDGACFMTALHNAGMEFDLDEALDEMIVRGRKMPGATCGQWGMCGSSASIGAALAIIHETGPLSHNEFYKDNLKLVSKALDAIGEVGGPRCCKRNAFLSLLVAVDFVKKYYQIELEKEEVHCEFSTFNRECIGVRCPFYSIRYNLYEIVEIIEEKDYNK